MEGIPMRSAGISMEEKDNLQLPENAFRELKGRASGRVPFFRAGYAGCMECTVHLLAGMPVCYIYRQQGGRQPSRPMAEGTSR